MTEHALIDFHNLPLTNDQKILGCLERIEKLLTPKVPEVTVETKPHQTPKSALPKGRK